MGLALRRFDHAPLPQKVLGQGLAATGNTRKLAGLEPISTESYVLKLLVEVGIVGLLAIGAILIWALAVFIRLAWRARGRPEVQSLAAAGVGLTLYAAIYPTLEPQLTALTWWLLLVLALKALDTEAVAGAAVRSV
jgi:O-antigen ligase